MPAVMMYGGNNHHMLHFINDKYYTERIAVKITVWKYLYVCL